MLRLKKATDFRWIFQLSFYILTAPFTTTKRHRRLSETSSPFPLILGASPLITLTAGATRARSLLRRRTKTPQPRWAPQPQSQESETEQKEPEQKEGARRPQRPGGGEGSTVPTARCGAPRPGAAPTARGGRGQGRAGPRGFVRGRGTGRGRCGRRPPPRLGSPGRYRGSPPLTPHGSPQRSRRRFPTWRRAGRAQRPLLPAGRGGASRSLSQQRRGRDGRRGEGRERD